MSLLTHVRLRYWFYPIGNTPAVNLLRDFAPPSNHCTRILCLGCGDVRNILFTLWSENPFNQRVYKFTTCDSEPAVLARNVFLFSFLMDLPDDGSPHSKINLLWEMYYHFFITSKALATLREHITKLLTLSGSIVEWNGSRYGLALKFFNEDTFAELGHYWRLYRDACKDNRVLKARMKVEIQEVFTQHVASKGGTFLHGSRAAGFNAILSSGIMSDAYRNYWKTGVVAGNQADVSALERDAGGHANPLLALSSAALGTFAVHYGTDPLLGFHLAEVFDKERNDTEMLNSLAECAKSQFQAWCLRFVRNVDTDCVELFFHYGEAVALCYELQTRLCGYAGFSKVVFTYSRPWSSSLLVLEQEVVTKACHPVDVIDSSNISDHVGVLNLLPAVIPLLEKNYYGVLYTETLLRAANDMSKHLDELLRTDVGSFSLIAGLSPTGYLLGISMEHFGMEVILGHPRRNEGRQSQMRIRVTWQKPFRGDSAVVSFSEAGPPYITADAEELALLMFNWYLQMFSASENINMQPSVHIRRALNPLSQDLNLYARTTLVSLVGLAKRNLRCDWSKCIDVLLQRIQSDRTLFVGSNSLQELYMLLHISGMHTIPVLENNPRAAAAEFAENARCPITSSLTRYPEVPNIVNVTLVVPRQHLHIFTSADLGRIGTPGLHLAVYNSNIFDNSFFGIHTCFGKLKIDHSGKTGVIEEDWKGWRGQSDLVVTAPVPAFQFLVGKESETRVALVVNTGPSLTYFIPLLGPHLRVFDTAINDHENLHLLTGPPGATAALETPTPSPPTRGQVSRPRDQISPPTVSVSSRNGRFEVLTASVHYYGRDERRSLEEGSTIELDQDTPCTISVKFGNHSRRVEFPLPVDSSRSKTRVSRKQSWIEVSVPTSPATHQKGYALRPFPVVRNRQQLLVWGMSNINLNQQPIIPRNAPMKYLSAFLGMTLSEAEQNSRHIPPNSVLPIRPLFHMKETIAGLFLGFRGQDGTTAGAGKSWNAFSLATKNDSDILIFANALRHDRDSGSVCLDAHVVPLTRSRISLMSKSLQRLVEKRRLLSIKLAENEETLWKHLMPSLVERCRVSWEHKEACEYVTDAFTCPVGVAHGETPICSCGEGKDASGIPSEYNGFRWYATRIALPTISAVPFVEPMQLTSALNSNEILESSVQNSVDATDAIVEREKTCDACGVAGSDLKLCTRCGKARYCNKACQSQAWKVHKATCKAKENS